MSKSVIQTRQETFDNTQKEGLVQKLCGTIVEKKASDFAQPVVDIIMPTIFKRGIEVFNTNTRIQKLRAEATPDTPDWQVTVAGIAGTGASVATALPLEAALTLATSRFMLNPGPVGATSVAIWYGGSLCTLNIAEKARDTLEQAVLNLNLGGAWNDVESLSSSGQNTTQVYHHIPVTDTDTSRLGLEKLTDNTRVTYESTTGVETSVKEVADAVLLQKETGTLNTFFDATPKVLVSLPDGEHIAYIGTAGNDVLDASASPEPVEIYAGKGDDTAIGGERDDHIVLGKGKDRGEGGTGYDTYYGTYNEGKKTISDSDGQGEIQFNAQAVKGTLTPSTNRPGQYYHEREDATFIFTRTTNEAADQNGADLTMTVDKALDVVNLIIFRNRKDRNQSYRAYNQHVIDKKEMELYAYAA